MTREQEELIDDELRFVFGTIQNMRMVARYIVDNNIKVELIPGKITDLIATPGFHPTLDLSTYLTNDNKE